MSSSRFHPASPEASFSKELEGIRMKAIGPDPARPTEIFHYTTLAAAVRIIETGEIWATDSRFTNDPKELTYAWPVIKAELLKCGVPTGFKQSVCDFVEEEQRKAYFRTYIASFTEHPDDLSQWRGYADNGSGVALGVRASRIAEWREGHLAGPMLTRMHYGDSRLRRVSRQFFTQTSKALDRFLQDHPRRGRSAFHAVRISFLIFQSICGVTHKQKPFSVENEWRAFCISRSRSIGEGVVEMDSLGFRATGYGVAPYVRIPLREERAGSASGKLLVSSVRIGPKKIFAASSSTLEVLLRKSGARATARVLPSAFEYR